MSRVIPGHGDQRTRRISTMFARLCQHHIAGEVKRRHSWSSESDFQLPDRLLPIAVAAEDQQSSDSWQHSQLDEVAFRIPDLVGPCRDIDDGEVSSSSCEEREVEEEVVSDMGQRSSSFLTRSSRPKISLTWVLRGDREQHSATLQPTTSPATTTLNNNNNNNIDKPNPVSVIAGCPPTRTLSEPSLVIAHSESGKSGRSGREKTRHRRAPRHKTDKHRRHHSRFGYEIQDVDAFLTKASLEKPANIPVVLASSCVLYQTRLGGFQEEVALPLGMVVNAVFKNQKWLYVQTPHGEEGYVSYGSCLPLGILPPPQRSHSTSKPPPCWETHTDIFPRPVGNRTDTEKLRDGTRSECGARDRCYGRRTRDAVSACGERSVDRLYLRAAASAKSKGTTRHTLLVIRSDYHSKGRNTLSVSKGDVVALVSGHIKDWFWVRSRDGNEGFIPSVVAGHGFL